MDTTVSKNAAKKRRQRENRAAANSPTPAALNPFINNAPSTNTAAIIDDLVQPTQAIRDLWKRVALKAAKVIWQRDYIAEQMQLKAEVQSNTEAITSTAKSAPPVQANPNDTATSNPSEHITSIPLPPLPLLNGMSDVRQEAENYYYK
jgi:hypothetical protein